MVRLHALGNQHVNMHKTSLWKYIFLEYLASFPQGNRCIRFPRRCLICQIRCQYGKWYIRSQSHIRSLFPGCKWKYQPFRIAINSIFNTPRPEQNRRELANSLKKVHVKSIWIEISWVSEWLSLTAFSGTADIGEISHKVVHNGPSSALVPVMAWCCSVNKPLRETKITQFTGAYRWLSAKLW